MILSAITVGYAIPPGDFDAIIHSVFRRAINLRCGPEGGLLTIIASPEVDLPQGIRVAAPDRFSFEFFHVGEEALCRDNWLDVGLVGIDLRGAIPWTCDLPRQQIDLADPAVFAAWRFAWEVLSRRQIASNVDIVADELLRDDGVTRSVVAGKAGIAVRDLVDATWRRDVPRAASSVGELIGLGYGLTPSGDDLLVGYIAGLWCTVRGQNERTRFAEQLGNAILHRSSGTNEISRAYLCHAVRAQVSSPLANLATALCPAWNADHLRDLVDSATRLGHTSGMDTITGLLVGLAAWDLPLPPQPLSIP